MIYQIIKEYYFFLKRSRDERFQFASRAERVRVQTKQNYEKLSDEQGKLQRKVDAESLFLTKFDSIPITSISIPIKITGPINVTLPRESVELTIDFENDPNDSFENVSLSFQWEVIAGTGLATAKAYNRRKLTLVQLKSGVIVVRATVTGKDFNGRAEHTLELIEPPEASRPPQAVIRPEGPIESVEGNTLTLDAEGSLVSATPASFEWVQVSGPTVALSATNTPSLKIERLAQGVYKFRVTVSDTEGRSDSTTVTVNVKEERDDPPKAHITECGTGTATGMVSVRLPLNHIHLCANSSQDDKGIVEYRWYRVDSFTHELTVDIDGSSSNVLELRNLQATEQLGAYEFALDVVDGKHQKDSTKVSVFVHAAHNLPPEPNGGGNRTVILPESSLVLEGNAKDDGVIKAFNWTQISGPSTISIVNANQAKATISKLILGDYIFQFSVTDDGGLEAHDIVKVSVIRGENKPPIALAENVTVSLPISVVKLDGSASHDDAGIVAYRWTPDDDTPAILELLDGSQNTPVLLVGGLVEGIFKFNFSVRDQQEEKDEKWVWLHVEKGEAERESVELLIRQSVERFSYLQKSKLENRIAAILSSGVSGVSQLHPAGIAKRGCKNGRRQQQMDATPSAEDHTRITILVKQIGSRNPQTFNRIIERLNRQHGLQVGDSAQPRIVQANFVTNVANESIKFGEFQIHRRIVGIIGVACRSPSTSESNQNRERSPNEKTMAIRRRSSVGVIVGIDDVKIFYENLKSDFSSTLVDSRCILIGYNEEDCTTRFASREALQFAAMEDADGLEEAIREFVRNIYFVHEQKRMDVAFEKVDPPPCPLLPEEEKLRVGTENKTSKTFRRKCIGRCRKHQADYTLLAGLPSQALEHYQNAIELLKSANDFLWLAGALEGWACAAMALIFEEMNTNRSSMHRVATLTPAQLREAAQGKNYHSLGVNHGHQRYRSDEDASRFSTTNSAERDVERNGSGGRKTALSWIKLDRKDKLDSVTILESFEQAIEHYGKFGFASFLEYECMMKATDLFRLQGRYIEMEEFHRTHVGKFLDDSFTKFDHQFKAQVCANSAEMYRKINFLRKSAFFSRLGVLFRLHVMDGETRTVADYRSVYPILFRTLYGYGINETASRDVTQSSSSQNGPIELQIKALHEVYTSSTRAQLSDAAIRHLCHLLQGYYPFLEPSMRARLISELATLRKAEERRRKHQAVQWVVGAHCLLRIHVYNCLPQELVVRELCVLGEGVTFETVPLRLSLPPSPEKMPQRTSDLQMQHDLIVVPRTPGQLTITGYSCSVFGLKNVCKLRARKSLTIEILPELPLLVVQSSLPKAPISSVDGEVDSAEITIYSGQTFQHSLALINSSDKLGICDVRVQITQPKVNGGPSLIKLANEFDTTNDSLCTPTLESELEGLVPVGALLSSIPLLKQLVLPAISLELIVNGVPYLSQDDLSVGIGDVNVLEIAVISSLDYEFHGEMELECEQEVLLRRKSIPRPHNLVIVGSRKVPFSVPTKGGDDSLLTPKSKIVFRLLFRVEGVYKVRPIVRARREEQQLFADEVFSSPISFNVSTKTR
ncbi:unnamed protein product, partial [Mesorhabditis belari]|uniref:Uncharacterized protein n=1 Tax=Mesorhabditis belari TaxID=2138241 RepID=A0AAF3EYL7_9BILA